MDTSQQRNRHDNLLHGDCGYLQWSLEEPLLQNWGFSVSLVSRPAHHRRTTRVSAADKDSATRPGAPDTLGRVAPEDSMQSSAPLHPLY